VLSVSLDREVALMPVPARLFPPTRGGGTIKKM